MLSAGNFFCTVFSQDMCHKSTGPSSFTMEDHKLSENPYSDCTLCPRKCHVDRTRGEKGFCGMGAGARAAKAYNHMWEEPVLTGSCGSGTVFFSGCNLRCIFCQNSGISQTGFGEPLTPDRLSDIFLSLQEKKASNINLVTGVMFIPDIRDAIIIARKNGLFVPVVYNSGGYESPDALKLLDGLIDIYMPDFKYMSEEAAGKYSAAPDYSTHAKASIAEMFRQTGPVVLGENGMMKRGLIVRHLVLPGLVKDSKKILRYLHETYGNDIYVSIMSQYTPVPSVKDHPLLGRKITAEEYDRVLKFAEAIGIENGFTQTGEAAEESFIPSWDLDGIKQ